MFTTLDLNFVLKLMINMMSVIVLVFGCYMRCFAKVGGGNRDHAASFLLFGTGVFIVTSLLHSVDLSMGFAFGLFAVFSMLRYRTESISVKEMTYLFLVIAMSLLSAVGKLSLPELVLLHALICVSALACETTILSSGWKEQLIQYEKIDNIKPERRQELITDLCLRTGLAVKDVSIVEIDFLRDTAQLRVYYTESCGIYSTSGDLGLPNAATLADTNETLRFRAK